VDGDILVNFQYQMKKPGFPWDQIIRKEKEVETEEYICNKKYANYPLYKTHFSEIVEILKKY